MFLHGHLRTRLIAQLGELAEQVPLIVVDTRRRLDEQGHSELTTPAASQPRNTLAVHGDASSRLGSRRNGDPYGLGLRSGVGKVGLQSGHHDLGTQSGCRHRDLDHDLKIVTFATEYFVRCHLEFDVQITSGTAARADFALGGQVDAVARTHAGRNLHVDRSGGADPAVS